MILTYLAKKKSVGMNNRVEQDKSYAVQFSFVVLSLVTGDPLLVYFKKKHVLSGVL